MSRQDDGSQGIGSPISNDAYNVLAALHSKLEGMEAYRKFAQDENPDLWRQLTQLDGQAVELLVTQLESMVGEGRLRAGEPGRAGRSQRSSGGSSGRAGSSEAGGRASPSSGKSDGEGGGGRGSSRSSTRSKGEGSGGGRVNPIQMQRFLGGLDYPVRKEDLIKRAQERGADENVMSALQQLSEEEYESPIDVSQAVSRGG